MRRLLMAGLLLRLLWVQSCAPYYRLRLELSVQNDFTFRGLRLVAPVALPRTLVDLAHEGHQGIVRTKRRLREVYWWPGMDDLVNTQVKSSCLCQSSDKSAAPSELA